MGNVLDLVRRNIEARMVIQKFALEGLQVRFGVRSEQVYQEYDCPNPERIVGPSENGIAQGHQIIIEHDQSLKLRRPRSSAPIWVRRFGVFERTFRGA